MLSYRELSTMQHAKLAQQVQLGAPVTAATIVGMVIVIVVAMVIALSMRRHRGVAIRFSKCESGYPCPERQAAQAQMMLIPKVWRTIGFCAIFSFVVHSSTARVMIRMAQH